MPVGQVIAPPIAPLVGRKKVVVSFVSDDDGIGSGAVATPIAEIWDGRESVI